MTDSTLAPSPAVGTCSDTPGWTFDSAFGEGPVACSSFMVSCIIDDGGAKENCCKCKEECCGKCDASAGTDYYTCRDQITLSPILQPAPRPSSPPSDTTACLCSGYVMRTTTRGDSVSVRETYTRTCPRELVPNWPEDCDQCCSYVSSAQIWAYLSLLVIVPIAALLIYYCRKKQRKQEEAQEAKTNVVNVAEAIPVKPFAEAKVIDVQGLPPP